LIVLLYNPRGVTCDDRVWRYAPGYDGIRSNYRVPTDHKFTLTAQDGGSEADPTPFLNSDCPAFCCSLLINGNGHIFKRMVVIHDEHRRGEKGIPLNMNVVLSRNHATSSDLAAVVEQDHGFTVVGDYWDVQPDITA
jgi:hypothetical protein